jgi:hypothetical protein
MHGVDVIICQVFKSGVVETMSFMAVQSTSLFRPKKPCYHIGESLPVGSFRDALWKLFTVSCTFEPSNREVANIIPSESFNGCPASWRYFANVRRRGSISAAGDFGPLLAGVKLVDRILEATVFFFTSKVSLSNPYSVNTSSTPRHGFSLEGANLEPVTWFQRISLIIDLLCNSMHTRLFLPFQGSFGDACASGGPTCIGGDDATRFHCSMVGNVSQVGYCSLFQTGNLRLQLSIS